jgi:hypothetical protein
MAKRVLGLSSGNETIAQPKIITGRVTNGVWK